MEEFTKMVEPESVKDDLASARSCADCDEHTQEAKLMQSSLLPTKGLCHESVEIVPVYTFLRRER